MHYIPRIQEHALTRFLADSSTTRPVLLVEGARQVGKTTLVEHCLADLPVPVVAINLERQKRLRGRIDACTEFDDLQFVLRDECGFDPSNDAVLFIDESQESESLGGFVRHMKELWPRTWTILSGSTLSRLFRPTQRFPVGRVARLLVTPFSFSEFLLAVGKGFLAEKLRTPEAVSAAEHDSLCRELDRFLVVGGLPSVVASHIAQADWEATRRELAAGYYDDLKRILGEKTMTVVKACLRAVAYLAGSGFKNTTVIPSLSTRQNELVNHMLSRLEDWKLILKSEQEGIDPMRSYRYHPKRYLFDTGMLRDMRESATPTLRMLDTPNPEVRAALGAVIENQVAIDLSRWGQKIAGWKKSSSGSEIDFVIKTPQAAIPVECKAALRIKGTHIDGPRVYLRQYAQRTGAIVSLAPFQCIDCDEGMTVVNVPLYCAESLRDILSR